ncbi:MAG: multiheme c-type cytochrome [Nitrospiraceae bacterium]|nr:multiheme c-type cytochrome [Nitrospiraceae bacterium]
MKRFHTLVFFLLAAFVSCALPALAAASGGESAPVSPQSQACIACHRIYTPGIVEGWLASRHSKVTPAMALSKPALEREFSAAKAPEGLENEAVGCFECHGRNPKAHTDNFEHFGFSINVIVSPRDCAACHPVEEAQFSRSKMAYAWNNLENNPLFHTLVDTTIGVKEISDKGAVVIRKPSAEVAGNTCYGCHGMRVKVKGFKRLETPVGIINVPDLTNWPNTGVGRVNPDGSRGACDACHPGHSFSIATARKPYTCAQCHMEPDVPAWDVYDESKHGGIFLSEGSGWNFTHVPWRPGVDFKTPTCAACHSSLLAGPDGNVIAERTHDFGSRLWIRLFGLIYTTAQPKNGDTTIIKNKDGLPLPVTFTGEPASKYLIGKDEQARREGIMKSVCNSCHSGDWTNGHFKKMDETVKEADQMTYAATKLMLEAWQLGIADKTNPFDEALEMDWVRQWLFYANTVKYAAAMTGAPDYTSFKNGFWDLSYNIQKMKDEIEAGKMLKGIGAPAARLTRPVEKAATKEKKTARKTTSKRKRVIHKKYRRKKDKR